MKRLKSIIISIVLFAIMLSTLSACGKKVNTYYINDSGDLIAVYKNNKEKNLGTWGDELILSLKQVSVDNNGYYIINGVKTSITTKVPKEYSVNSNGHLIVKYKDNTTDDLGDLSKSLANGILSIEISDDGYYIINGITTNIVSIDVYNVSFNSGFSQTISSQKIKDGYKVERPVIERKGYTLSKWTCNGEEWRFNSDIVKNDMILDAIWTANEYTVSFENEKGDNPIDIIIAYDSEMVLPMVDNVDGYTFKGWYNGFTRITDGIWNIDNDVTLTAKWTANQYNITLDPGAGSVSKTTQKVVYDQPYTLPVPTNDYGVFVGWFCDGVALTDNEGNSLNDWTFTENKTLYVDWEIEIYNASDLINMRLYSNAAYKLMEDIDLDGVLWIPIGTVSEPFTGILDGNNHKISNLSLNNASNPNILAYGLFGWTGAITIKNLTLENFEFTSSNINKSYYVGSFIGTYWGEDTLTFINCKTSGSIQVASQSSSNSVNAGGFIGDGYNVLFSGCVNNVSVSGAYYAGGFVGHSVYSYISMNSVNMANISATSIAGGLAGRVSAAGVDSSMNLGNVYTTDCAGGIIGIASSGGVYISKTVNKGDVTATSSTDIIYYSGAGILGSQNDGNNSSFIEIVDCYNTGTITAYRAAGIHGLFIDGSIQNCYNSGDIRGEYIACGIAVQCTSNLDIIQCLATGSIELTGSIGLTCSLTFAFTGANIRDCYYTYSSSSINSQANGTYTNDYLGSHLYKDLMYWDEYNSTTKRGTWVFNNFELPTLYIEDYLNLLML